MDMPEGGKEQVAAAANAAVSTSSASSAAAAAAAAVAAIAAAAVTEVSEEVEMQQEPQTLLPPLPPQHERAYISYVAELGLGSPPQWHSFVVDTGSASLAVSGPVCMDMDSNTPCDVDEYDPGES